MARAGRSPLTKLSPAARLTVQRVERERRTAPRYPVDTTSFASLDGQTMRPRNISRHGVVILGRGLVAGSTHLLEIHLNRRHLLLRVEILDCNDGELLHGRFIATGATTETLIAAYISPRSRATLARRDFCASLWACLAPSLQPVPAFIWRASSQRP